MIFFLLFTVVYCQVSQLPYINLRPKPKARAGGADDVVQSSTSVIPK